MESERLLHRFLTGEKATPEEVSAHCLKPACESLAWAAGFYGRVCRDFALDMLARGGLYSAGGMAARTPAVLTHMNFRKEFVDSSTMGHVLSKISVFLLDNQHSGLWGAAFHGQQLLKKRIRSDGRGKKQKMARQSGHGRAYCAGHRRLSLF